jgi:hypothetical protein
MLRITSAENNNPRQHTKKLRVARIIMKRRSIETHTSLGNGMCVPKPATNVANKSGGDIIKV